MGPDTVKLARAQDYRRRLEEKAGEWTTRITRVSFNGIPSLGHGDIPFQSPLTVLCGPNGVGKTTLLRAIWACLDPEASNSSRTKSLKLSAGTTTVDLSLRGIPQNTTGTFAGGVSTAAPEIGVEVVHLDAANEASRLQDEFAGFENPEDIINGIGSKTLSDKELAKINYLTKRDYREIKLYEVEAGDGVAPFFEVTLGPDRYDSRTMGAGEFASFFLWWSLTGATPNSIMLIEEPESFLSPGAQSAFGDHLISVLCEKKICAVVTSHSGEIIAPLPDSSIRFLRRDNSGVRLSTDSPSPILLETIGIKTRVDILAFVEDQAAASFCKLWIEAHEPFLSRRMCIVVKNGDGEIVNLLKCVDTDYGEIKILGIFDGDMRGRTPAVISSKALFLPGERPIEHIFRNMVTSDPAPLSAELGGRDLSDILFAIQGSDHHDWFLSLSDRVGLYPGQMFMALHKIWMQSEDNRRAAKMAFDSLRAVIEPPSDGGGPEVTG